MFPSRTSVDATFANDALCIAARHQGAKKGWNMTRQTCQLFANNFFQKCMLVAWFTYIIGFAMHALNLLQQLFALIACKEKK